MAEGITYRQLFQILTDLGFGQRSVPDSHVAYEHEPSDTLILLAPHELDERARPIDVKYVRRVLDEKGLLTAKSFDHCIAKALSSHTA